MNCQIPNCKREANSEIMFRGYEVCRYHEQKHFESDGLFIWHKLGLDPCPKENQLTL